MLRIQSQILPHEDALVFSILVSRNVGATKLAEVDTLDENGNALVQTQTVDASRPDSNVIDVALNAVVSTFSKNGFAVRANASQVLLGETLTDGETAKLVVDAFCQKTTLKPEADFSTASETLATPEVE